MNFRREEECIYWEAHLNSDNIYELRIIEDPSSTTLEKGPIEPNNKQDESNLKIIIEGAHENARNHAII
jgi:hypothetical protein